MSRTFFDPPGEESEPAMIEGRAADAALWRLLGVLALAAFGLSVIGWILVRACSGHATHYERLLG